MLLLPADVCTIVSDATSREGSGVSWLMIFEITWSSVTAMCARVPPVSGRVQLSHVDGVKLCTEPAVAAFSRLPNDDTYFLYGSSGDRIGLRVKSAPEPRGVHLSMAGPCDVLCMMAPWGR